MSMTLRQFLTDENLTPEEFGAKIGVEGTSVRRYLDGTRFPRPRILIEIERKTGGKVTANDLMHGAGRKPDRARKPRAECRA